MSVPEAAAARVHRPGRALATVVGLVFVDLVGFGIIVMFIPFVADVYGFDATGAAALLTYVGVLGALNQGVLVGRLARVIAAPRLAMVGAAGLLAALVGLAREEWALASTNRSG